LVALAAVLVAAVASRAFAQSSEGSVGGTVRDDSGAVVSGANVRLAGEAGTLQAQTAADGTYQISGVPYGTYRFTATTSAGHVPFAIESLTVGGEVRQDVTLRRNYADTRAGATIATDAADHSSAGCGPARLADSDQTTAVRTESPTAGSTPRPRTFTVRLSSPLGDPEVRIDPGAGCAAAAAAGLYRYDLLASADGSSFTQVATGTFSPSDAGRTRRVTLTGVPASVRAVRLVARETFAAPLGQSDGGYLSIAELQVLARTPTPPDGTPGATPTPTPTPVVRYRVAMQGQVRPRRDVNPPFRFIARGKLLLPFTVPPEQGCSGKVRITASRNGRFAGGRLAGVASDCTFVHDVPLRRKVLGSRGTARFILRFQGNLQLRPTSIRVNAAYGPARPAKPRRARRCRAARRPRRCRQRRQDAAPAQRPRAARSRR
jgi:hypothetical protein